MYRQVNMRAGYAYISIQRLLAAQKMKMIGVTWRTLEQDRTKCHATAVYPSSLAQMMNFTISEINPLFHSKSKRSELPVLSEI